MKQLNHLFLFFLIASCLSCGETKEKRYAFVKSDTSLSFPLERNVKNSIHYMALYTEGKEYLTFQNQVENEILFYDMNTCELDFTITPAREGSQGVGRFLGYHIHNLDSIYLTNFDYGVKEIALIDKNANLKRKIKYATAVDGTPLSDFNFSTASYRPGVVVGRKMYIYSGPNRLVEKDPVTTVLDMDTETIQALPFLHIEYPGSDTKIKLYGWEDHFSRCYDGKRFIYSYNYEEDIFVATPEHDSIYRVKVKSESIDKLAYLDELKATIEELCQFPCYGNLLYDKYRNLYYRIAHPRTELEKGIRPMELLEYGGRNFSILILDADFKVVGETLFPDYTYNPKLMLIREDGLYISDSHYLNPNFSDDVLSFVRFDLVVQ